ncbi:MAG TPA: glutaminyl-peptide cyclotransferase [Terracidiphilus sp.]|nr:glutaminyl-peptide cyclotransferase [Terracidiphilus sp.]
MRQSSLSRALAVLFFLLIGCAPAPAADTYRVIHTYPHDAGAFTQGLIYLDGHLYESTGIRGKSSLREEDLETGRILKYQALPDRYFGEGLTNWGNELIQLTWTAHTALVYDLSTFRFIRSFPYDYEGWGLTQDGKDLIESDGSSTLRFIDPSNFHTVRTITVRDHGKPITQLNELEFIHGEIYSNVWHTNRIVRISPATGDVLGTIDLAGLLPPGSVSDPEAVLNGIAYDPVHNRLFVTGKLWPKLFEIQVVPQSARRVPVHDGK